jgi:hypothetical protein
MLAVFELFGKTGYNLLMLEAGPKLSIRMLAQRPFLSALAGILLLSHASCNIDSRSLLTPSQTPILKPAKEAIPSPPVVPTPSRF